jgi:hypothetical protein
VFARRRKMGDAPDGEPAPQALQEPR